jgi:hypothetical protein
MSGLIDVMRVVVGLNLIMLVGLGYVWAGNLRTFRSKHALGLFAFAVLLFVENALAFYYFMFDPTLAAWITNPSMVPTPAQVALTSLRLLEFAGLLFLTWITWD